MPSSASRVCMRGLSCFTLLNSFLVLVLAFTSRALAQDAPEPPAYREIVQEALAEYEAQNYLEAKSLFSRAYKLFPNARPLRGLGVVSFELHRYSESIVFLQQALASREKPLEGSLRQDAERLLARAKGFVAQVTVTIQPRDARVAVDGAEARPVPSEPLLLDIGTHQLDFQAPGYVSEHRSYSAEGGESQTWNITLRGEGGASAMSSSALPAHERAGAPNRKMLVIGGTAAGLGVAGFVVAGVFTAKRAEAGVRLRALGDAEAVNSASLPQWQKTRPQPYIFGTIGAVALTSGVMGLLLSQERKAFPWWGSALAGTAGVGLATWGVVDLARGASCDGAPRLQRACSGDLERRDVGALLVMSAVPLLAVPITQLVRRALEPVWPAATVAISPQLNLVQKTLFLDARVHWL